MRIWKTPAVVSWSLVLLESFNRWTGHELVEWVGSPEDRARTLFFASFAVVSHNSEVDPILNYGNKTALELWNADWAGFTRTPSRLTAEPVNRAERERMLAQATTRGWIDDYRGLRISMTGRRFLVEQAIVWNVMDADGQRQGQAATFSRWSLLDPED